MRKWLVVILLMLVALPLLAAGGAAAWLMTADLRPLVERRLSAALQRPVRIGALGIRWGDPLTLDIRDISIANPPWAEPAEMLTLAHAFARIDALPLLHGTLRYQRLDVEKLVLVLERNEQGIGNWKFGADAKPGGSHASMMPGPAVIPKDRSQMPTLLDFTIADSQIRYRTSSGQWLTVAIADLALDTAGDDQPVTISGDGAYNGIPARLQLGADSFEKLREARRPFGLNFSLANDLNAVNFQGTATNPLDFDGVDGAMTIDSRRLDALLRALGADIPASLPLDIAGPFARSGDRWSLDPAKGQLAGNAFTGGLVLDEGPRGGTDRLALTLDFDRLLLDGVIDKVGSGPAPADPLKTGLDLPGRQSPELALRLSAGRFQFRKLTLADLRLAGTLGPGRLSIESLRFPFAGTRLNARGTARQQGRTTAVTLSADLLGADIAGLLKSFGIDTGQIAGKVDARADLAGAGATLGDLLARGSGEAVLAMREGRVAKDVLEKASTDLRTLFRKGEGASRVDCLLGVAEIKDGIATVSPLKLYSPDAKLVGGGTVDLRKRRLDLVIKSDPKSTGFFALDIPIRVTGPLAHPAAEPSSKAKIGDPPPTNLSPATQQLVQQSGCAS
ncbi:MAG TPA: AsmA-like C-terminal region-containing protein [Dongiaceae bacterium]|nr:AsmA-like C-terminal region-containing protein [Dongiaceae bacterium]